MKGSYREIIMKSPIKIISAIIVLGNIVGCAAVQTSLEHKNLEVSSQQSETIFLDEVPKAQKTVHVSIKNTSDQEMDISNRLKKAIQAHGYKIANNPNSAHYILQANILKVGKMSLAASKEALGHGYGSVLTGVGTAAVAGGFGASSNTMIGAGLVGGLVDMAANSLVKDVNFSMITDVQVSERVNHKVTESNKSNLANGSSSQTIQNSNTQSNFQRYRTRVVSSADKVNLEFAEAKPKLEQSLIKVISGIF